MNTELSLIRKVDGDVQMTTEGNDKELALMLQTAISNNVRLAEIISMALQGIIIGTAQNQELVNKFKSFKPGAGEPIPATKTDS